MEMEKLIIAGAGPAGVSAALYAVRSGITPLVLHKGGGALEKAVKIENYYGLPEPVTGAELYKTGLKQLESFQIPVVEEELLAVEYDGDYTVQTTEHTYHSKALILATGAKRNTLALKELKKYEGSGISYCAVCCAQSHKETGYGNPGAVFQLNIRKGSISSGGDHFLSHHLDIARVFSLEIRFFSVGEDRDLCGQGLQDFCFMKGIRAVAQNSHLFSPVEEAVTDSTDIARKLGLVIENNHILIEPDTSTPLPGLYAAGDCTGGMLQIAKAVYEGALAGTKAVSYLKTLKKES